MQAAGMLRGTRAVYLLVFLISLIGYAHPLPLQVLPSIPGYIPVYIRHGDQPLEEINPALAEAFHETPSVPKSIRLDNIPDPTDTNLEEEEADAFIGKSKKKNIYPVHVRQTESSTHAPIEDKATGKKPAKNSDLEDIKLLSIYELHDEEDKSHRRNHHEGPRRRPVSVSKEAVIKVSPLSQAEKDDIERQAAVHAEKEESRPNDLHDSNPNYPDLPAEVPHHRDSAPDFTEGSKVGQIVDEETTVQPSRHLIKDLSNDSSDQDTPASPIKDHEDPVKEERRADVLSNVYKISPTVLPEAEGETAEGGSISREEIVETRQDYEMKDLTERNDDVSAN